MTVLSLAIYNRYILCGISYQGGIFMAKLGTNQNKSNQIYYTVRDEIISGKYQGRTNSDQIIVANPSGMAVDDFAVTNIFIEAALEKGVGTILPL